MAKQFKEYPKMVYTERGEIIVKSAEEEREVLEIEEKIVEQIATAKKEKPMLKCRFCGKEYKLPLHLVPHEKKCEELCRQEEIP